MKNKIMKNAFTLFKRNGVFYLQSTRNKAHQRSLRTRDEDAAQKLLKAENEAATESALNLELAKVYAKGADPMLAKRTWQSVMEQLASHGKESSQTRCKRAMQSKPFDHIRNKILVKTTQEDFKIVLKRGGAATNNYLRRLHNLALDEKWLLCPIISGRNWEVAVEKQKRGITLSEHEKILASENLPERKHYYQMLWLLGAAQSDAALLRAENINWKERVLSYQRMKTGEWAQLRIGTQMEELLKVLPQDGYLFPYIASLSPSDRSAEFSRRCKIAKVSGVSLHCYRYAWAERAYAAGYSERYAQAALGHKSRAVHHHYAKNAAVICPPLEEFESKIIPLTNTNSSAVNE